MASYNGNWHVEELGRPVRDQLDRHRRSTECVETPASVTTTITTASADDVTRHFAHAIAAIRNRRAGGRAGSAGLQLQYKPTSAAASPTHYRRSSSRNQNHEQSPPRHRAVDRESGEIFYAQDNRITLYARAHRDRQEDRLALCWLHRTWVGGDLAENRAGRCRRTAGMGRGGGGRPSGCKAPRSPPPLHSPYNASCYYEYLASIADLCAPPTNRDPQSLDEIF